jgi:epoxide hydrolase 4
LPLEVMTIISRGLKTAWLQGANPHPGCPILFAVHGFPDSPYAFERQAAYFEQKCQVIAPFMRGGGPSEAPKKLSRYNPQAFALDAADILKEVDPTGQRPVFLVGHDLGCVHAWKIAEVLGARAKGLVILNGMPIPVMGRRLTNFRQLRKSWYMFAMQAPRLPELGFAWFPRFVLDRAYRVGGLAVSDRPAWEHTKSMLSGPLNQYRAFARMLPHELKKPQKSLGCRVLVLWGKEDGFLEMPRQAEFADQAREVTIRVLEGGHWLHREKPEAVNKLMEDFFQL